MKPSDLIPPGACWCGCGRPANRRFIKGHGGHAGGPPPIFVRQSGCWIWAGKLDAHGYGRLRRDGQDWLAHRWVFSRLVRPLRNSDVVDHLCRNHSCVNPAHLEPTTDAENVRRGRCAKLTPANVRQIRWEWQAAKPHMSQREFARRAAPLFGVAESTVRNLLCRKTWAEPKLREAA